MVNYDNSLIKLLNFKSEKNPQSFREKRSDYWQGQENKAGIRPHQQHTKKDTSGTAFLVQAKDFIFQPTCFSGIHVLEKLF